MFRFWLLALLSLNFLPLCAKQQFSVYFESDKFTLAPAEEARLQEFVKQGSAAKVVSIGGYTDEDGSTGYNDTLASKRVQHIFDKLKDKVAIRDDFKSRSFGEQHQQSANKALNRKVTIHFLTQGELPRENEILGIRDTVTRVKVVRTFPSVIRVPNPDGSKTEMKLDTQFMKELDQARIGDKLAIKDLNFRVNTFAVVPESRARLYELLIVMQQNPKLKIDIQGHLCCMPTDRLNLSTQRAKAVYNFLVGNEISKSRLSFQGFGSTKPLFPIPEKSEAERAANRRVEVYIIDN